MLLTTNKDPLEWGGVLHDADLSSAILDRLLHRGEILKLSGRSYRQHRPGQAPPEEPTPTVRAGSVTEKGVTFPEGR
jgi:hypothetical protein